MAGIMPDGGVAPNQASNTEAGALLKVGCTSLWHANRCQPRFDPASANAIISEILNAVNAGGFEYDCTKLDNLATALAIHEISGNTSQNFDQTNIESGSNKKIGGGNFTIPNTFHREIRVALYVDATMQWDLEGDDSTASLEINWKFNDTNDFTGVQSSITQRISHADKSQALNPVYFRVHSIPPGGRIFFWEARSTALGSGSWNLQYTETAISVRCYGVSASTRDNIALVNIPD